MIFSSKRNALRKGMNTFVAAGIGISVLSGIVFYCPQAQAQLFSGGDASGQEEPGREKKRASDGGFKKVAGVPLPKARDMSPSQSGRFAPSNSEGFPAANVPQVYAGGSVPVRKPAPSGDFTTQFPARGVFLNGVNIGSVREQELEGVRVRIDAHGNVHLFADHYDVHQDSSFHPLMPSELPRIPKDRAMPSGLPEGRYSKDGTRLGAPGTAPEQGSGVPQAIERGANPRPARDAWPPQGSREPMAPSDVEPAGWGASSSKSMASMESSESDGAPAALGARRKPASSAAPRASMEDRESDARPGFLPVGKPESDPPPRR